MNILFNTIKLVVVLISCLNINGNTIKEKNYSFDQTCGYEGCPVTPADKLNIHLVPHTHDDVGWLKTLDQYYYGSEPLIQKAGVQYILDSVIRELLADRNRRFIWVESAFFFKWYNEQSYEMKDKVKSLINEGRLEFIGGAWSMNDEGATHYQSIIDQFAWGLRQLEQTFGNCSRPRVGWQIDPFGHSKEMASIFAQMGYDGLFFARLDWKDKVERLKNKNGEMVWKSSNNLGKSSDLFTGILAHHYSAPPGFCFDFLCSDEPIMDGDDMMERNVENRLNEFYDYIKNMTKLYATNNLMVPMGDDFTYQDANMWYKNLDKIIKYSKNRKVNGQDVNIFYSTPSCYVKSLHDTGKTWPTESNDFFPYSSDPYTYWSGYFTSRPNLKYYERLTNNYFQVVKKIVATNGFKNIAIMESHLTLLREAMGIMQHHDAITGTEKQKVANDYSRILALAIKKTVSITQFILNEWILGENKDEKFEMESCFKLNTTECNITESSNTFMISLYNPLTYPIEHYVRVPVSHGQFEVKNSKGELVPVQLINIPKVVQFIPGRDGHASQELIFKAEVEAVNSYYVSKIEKSNDIIKEFDQMEKEKDDDINIVKNSRVELTFTKGLLTSVKSDSVEIKLKQEILFYEGAVGNNAEFKNRSSGAYIFLPKGVAQSFQNENKIEIKIVEGDLVKEVQQIYNDAVSQIIRIYETEDFVEFEWLVGPIPITDGKGLEIISRFESTDINSGNVFYTDSNGREMVKRIYNESFVESPIGGNYYPVTARIAIEEEEPGNNLRMAILNDRAQGGSSLKTGQIELMVHRRLLKDDAFGVGEALNETAYGRGIVARGKHRLVIGKDLQSVRAKEKNIQQKMLLQPWLFFSRVNGMNFDEWKTLHHNIKHKHDEDNIPSEVNILSLEPWGPNKILLRLENILEKLEGGKNVKFNIKNLFNNLNGKEIRETTLDGSKWLNETVRMEFKTENSQRSNIIDDVSIKPLYYNTKSNISNLEIELTPMQIRTFILKQ